MDAAWLVVVILVPAVAAAGAIGLIVFVRRQFARHGRRHESGR